MPPSAAVSGLEEHHRQAPCLRSQLGNAKTPLVPVTYPRVPSVAMYDTNPPAPPSPDRPVILPVPPSHRRRTNPLTMNFAPQQPYPKPDPSLSTVTQTHPVAGSR